MPKGKPKRTVAARLSRLGLASTADGGVDIVSNFGFIAQVKHAVLDDQHLLKLHATTQFEGMTVVCRSATLSNPSGSEDPSAVPVITEDDLIKWSNWIVHGDFGLGAADFLCERLAVELRREFPACDPVDFAAFITERGYIDMLPWKI